MPLAKFNYSLNYKELDLRKDPGPYRTGLGEQGVLLVEPYKSEILPYWRFKTPAIAKKSANKIYRIFIGYVRSDDFVGMDMARKFLQMGYTRARRYANHKGGRKYAEDGVTVLPRIEDPVKAESARIFKVVWDRVMDDPAYQAARAAHEERYEK